MTRQALLDLAAHHETQGLFHAKAAMNNNAWYHNHPQDTEKAAHHLTVARELRALAQENEHGPSD